MGNMRVRVNVSRNEELQRLMLCCYCIIATLSATFFESSPENPPAQKADLILPISTLINTDGDQASVPPDFSVRILLEFPEL